MMSECNTHWQANVIRVSWHMECIKAEQFTEFIMLFILFWVTVFAQCGEKKPRYVLVCCLSKNSSTNSN